MLRIWKSNIVNYQRRTIFKNELEMFHLFLIFINLYDENTLILYLKQKPVIKGRKRH